GRSTHETHLSCWLRRSARHTTTPLALGLAVEPCCQHTRTSIRVASCYLQVTAKVKTEIGVDTNFTDLAARVIYKSFGLTRAFRGAELKPAAIRLCAPDLWPVSERRLGGHQFEQRVRMAGDISGCAGYWQALRN